MERNYTLKVDEAELPITCAPSTILILQQLLEESGHKVSMVVNKPKDNPSLTVFGDNPHISHT